MSDTNIEQTNKPKSCESCDVDTGPFYLVDNILMCLYCKSRNIEVKLELASRAADTIPARVESVDNYLINSAEIDGNIRTHQDFFNSKTRSIQFLKESIDADENVVNKHFKLAEVINTRFKHLRDVLLPKIKLEESAVVSEQRAIQVYLNNLASSLRKDEREKLRISDITYNPLPLKKPSIPRVTKPKFDKVELRKAAETLGIPEYMLQQIVISKNISVSDAAERMRIMMAKTEPTK